MDKERTEQVQQIERMRKVVIDYLEKYTGVPGFSELADKLIEQAGFITAYLHKEYETNGNVAVGCTIDVPAFYDQKRAESLISGLIKHIFRSIDFNMTTGNVTFTHYGESVKFDIAPSTHKGN